eukprot:57467_1
MGNSFRKKSKQSNSSNVITSQLGNDQEKTQKNKILVLGSPNVGKSSIFKAIRWNIDKNRLNEDRVDYRSIIRGNCGHFMLQLLQQAANELDELVADDITVKHIKRLND